MSSTASVTLCFPSGVPVRAPQSIMIWVSLPALRKVSRKQSPNHLRYMRTRTLQASAPVAGAGLVIFFAAVLIALFFFGVAILHLVAGLVQNCEALAGTRKRRPLEVSLAQAGGGKGGAGTVQ